MESINVLARALATTLEGVLTASTRILVQVGISDTTRGGYHHHRSPTSGCCLHLQWLLPSPPVAAAFTSSGCCLHLQWLLPSPPVAAAFTSSGCCHHLQWLLPSPGCPAAAATIMVASSSPVPAADVISGKMGLLYSSKIVWNDYGCPLGELFKVEPMGEGEKLEGNWIGRIGGVTKDWRGLPHHEDIRQVVYGQGGSPSPGQTRGKDPAGRTGNSSQNSGREEGTTEMKSRRTRKWRMLSASTRMSWCGHQRHQSGDRTDDLPIDNCLGQPGLHGAGVGPLQPGLQKTGNPDWPHSHQHNPTHNVFHWAGHCTEEV